MRTGWKSTAAVVGIVAVLVTGCSSGSKHHGSSPSPTGSSPGTGVSSAPSTTTTTASSTSTGSSAPSPAVGPAGGAVPKGFVPSSVTFDSPTHGWVLGTAPCATQPCTSMVRTRDGGRTWVGIPAPKANLTEASDLRDGGVSTVRFADDRDGWAGGGDLWSTHNGGASWQKQSFSTFSGRVAGIATGGGYVYVAVYNCPSQGGNNCSFTTRVYASPVGRDAWTPVTGTVPGGGTESGLIVQDGTWFLPTKGGIWHGTGAAQGTRVANPCPSISPTIAAADRTHLDALCGGDGAAGSARYQLYGSTNGGSSWRATGPAHVEPSNLTGMADNAAGVLLVALSSGASVILRTTNDGGSYANARVSAPTGGYPWADLGFTTSTQAVVVLPGHGMYLSHDAGQSFAPVTF